MFTLTQSTNTKGNHVSRSQDDEVSYGACLNEVTGEFFLSGDDTPDQDIEGECVEMFVTNDFRVFPICVKCFNFILQNNKCMGGCDD